ncbi:MAG: FKBP-type peptidyl-prolyl cis-trans isomerase [Saprospiraceae bacterium]|nr:FKBP-type peptidyl-prolyl cis-trans isomerase [Saprospiraceae bacterium]
MYKMLRFFPILLVSCFSFWGCASDQVTSQSDEDLTSITGPDWSAIQATDNEALLLRLAGNLNPKPENHIEKGKNDATEWVIAQNWDMQTTRTGLLYQVVVPGDQRKIRWGDRLQVHYEGTFTDGTIFDSSFKRGKPLEFYLGNTIAGWNEGISFLGEGGKGVFVIPPHLGYGQLGLRDNAGKIIVPSEKILVFRVSVLSIIEPAD